MKREAPTVICLVKVSTMEDETFPTRTPNSVCSTPPTEEEGTMIDVPLAEEERKKEEGRRGRRRRTGKIDHCLEERLRLDWEAQAKEAARQGIANRRAFFRFIAKTHGTCIKILRLRKKKRLSKQDRRNIYHGFWYASTLYLCANDCLKNSTIELPD